MESQAIFQAKTKVGSSDWLSQLKSADFIVSTHESVDSSQLKS